MLALDVVLLLMIIICIVYCWILNQRIRDLHNSRVEFARMIKEFDAAVIKAESCIDDLSTLSKSTTEHVKKATDDADMVISELKTVYEIGDKACSKLEKAISESRKQQKELESLAKQQSAKNNYIAEESFESSESEYISENQLKNEMLDEAVLEESRDDEYKNEEYLEDQEPVMHQNLLEKVLHKITSHKNQGTIDQDSYYDTLRKVSVRK